MWLIRKSEEFVSSCVLIVGLRGHFAGNPLCCVCPPAARLGRITFILGYNLILIVKDFDFKPH
jgi:hypothetical protein